MIMLKNKILLILASVLTTIFIDSCKKDAAIAKDEIPALPIFNSNLEYGTMTDHEGNIYRTIKIGFHTWMAENLRTTKFNDGIAIPEINRFSGWWTNKPDPACCWYNGDITQKATYGALYNGYAVNTGKLAPKGWHIPSKDEWTALVNNLGGEKNAGYKLKEAGKTHWKIADVKVDNGSGFTAIPGGFRSGDYEFFHMGELTSWWSSTPFEPIDNNWYCQLVYNDLFGSVSISNSSRIMGYSVRCVKDN
jgi:uncharacterized protein (TIGR02145 family)